MPSANYAVVGTARENNNPRIVAITGQTPTGFTASVRTSDGNPVDFEHSIVVHGSNATLPKAITEEQIEAISKNGVAAWATTATDGTVASSLNLKCTAVSSNTFTYEFLTPLPSGDYGVSATGQGSTYASYTGLSSTGFQIKTYKGDGTAQAGIHSVAIFATNAAPPKGGTGADAWATINGTTINGSFNISGVSNPNPGIYDITFTTPLPAGYAVVVTPSASAGSVKLSNVTNATEAGCQIVITNANGIGEPSAFNVVVHATNAQLPDSFTEDEIQSVVDLAQSGVTNPGASAWAAISTAGNVADGMNVECAKTGTGDYVITFPDPMPNANYAVSAMANSTAARSISTTAKTADGFTLSVFDSDNVKKDAPVAITVFATNNVPLKGGVGADAWANVNNAAGLQALSILQIAHLTAPATTTIRLPAQCRLLIMQSSRQLVVTTEILKQDSGGCQ